RRRADVGGGALLGGSRRGRGRHAPLPAQERPADVEGPAGLAGFFGAGLGRAAEASFGQPSASYRSASSFPASLCPGWAARTRSSTGIASSSCLFWMRLRARSIAVDDAGPSFAAFAKVAASGTTVGSDDAAGVAIASSSSRLAAGSIP